MSYANRRGFLRGLLLGAAATTVATQTAVAAMPDEDRFLYEMLDGIFIGDLFYGKWALVDALPPRAGGVILVVQRGDEPGIEQHVAVGAAKIALGLALTFPAAGGAAQGDHLVPAGLQELVLQGLAQRAVRSE